jgi:hypothetical protein
VKQVLERLRESRGLPSSITVDKGPEFAGKVLDAWAYSLLILPVTFQLSTLHMQNTPGKLLWRNFVCFHIR